MDGRGAAGVETRVRQAVSATELQGNQSSAAYRSIPKTKDFASD